MSQVAETQSLDVPRRQLSHPDALYEVVDGQIKEKPELGAFSTYVANRLIAELFAFVKATQRGHGVMEMLFILDPARPLKRRPDLAFVSFERWPASKPIPYDGDWEVVPDLAVEVISPNDLDRDVQQKIREYFRSGVRQVWLVRPLDQTVTVYRSTRDVKIHGSSEELDGGDVLPGFRMALAPLFRATAD